jgi:hypothetical protein
MPITHDGIEYPLPLSPVGLGVRVAILIGGVWLATHGQLAVGLPLALVGLVAAINQTGWRRIRVIHSKLLVEDEKLISTLLIGPSRRRVGWEEVTAVHADGGVLKLDTKAGPFVTGDRAPAEDLKALASLVQSTWTRARAEAAAGER